MKDHLCPYPRIEKRKVGEGGEGEERCGDFDLRCKKKKSRQKKKRE